MAQNTGSKRYTLFPIKYPSLYAFYEKQRDAFWTPQADIDLETDVNEWRSVLTDNDKHFLTHTLAFFAQVDAIVLQNLNVNFSLDIDIPEATIFYGIQAGIEAVHWETYSLLIDTLIEEPEEKTKAFNAIESYPCIGAKAQWTLQWMNNEKPYMERLMGFICAEGILFSSSFASIYYYKKRGLLPGLTLSNKYIARDEGIHRDFGIELFSILKKEEPQKYHIEDDTVYEIIKGAVEVEEKYVNESLGVELIGIKKEDMITFVKLVADHLLRTMGYKKLYNVTNPFDWMDMINLSGKTNFFEQKVSEYKKPKNDLTEDIFSFDGNMG